MALKVTIHMDNGTVQFSDVDWIVSGVHYWAVCLDDAHLLYFSHRFIRSISMERDTPPDAPVQGWTEMMKVVSSQKGEADGTT